MKRRRTVNSPNALALANGLAQHLRAWGERLGTPPAAVAAAAAAAHAVSLATSAGHVALPLAELLAAEPPNGDNPSADALNRALQDDLFLAWAASEDGADEGSAENEWAAAWDTDTGHAEDPPSPTGLVGSAALAERRQSLLTSGLVGTPQHPGAAPLVLDGGGRLYLHRLFALERQLAQRLHQAASAPPLVNDTATEARLAELFAANTALLQGAPDWQRAAVALALRQRLTVISGGPGTGKTTAVVNLLACLLAAQPGARIQLAAPTGKAAARLTEALRERSALLPPAWAAVRAQLPTEAFTVHRLLGVLPPGAPGGQGGFRHHADHPLALDVLVVDEASMLDLALATRLLAAVPAQARIVLLGDKDQLAAVETGAVFAELSAAPRFTAATAQALARAAAMPTSALPVLPAADGHAALADSVVWFMHNFRFGAQSGIGLLAAQVREGQAEAALASLRQGQDPQLQWLPDGGGPAAQQAAVAGYAAYFQAIQAVVAQAGSAGDAEAAKAAATTLHAAFQRFRVLCALREGPSGVASFNQRVSQQARQAAGEEGGSRTWYTGRAVMVQRNDYTQRLFNGDIGIALRVASAGPGPNAENEAPWQVAFPQPDGSQRLVPVARLPAHQDAFAMTVHKAQGSEFQAVLVLLPAHRSPVLTRELLYTALTRARERATLAGPAEALQFAIQNPTQRLSGLHARLLEAQAAPEANTP